MRQTDKPILNHQLSLYLIGYSCSQPSIPFVPDGHMIDLAIMKNAMLAPLTLGIASTAAYLSPSHKLGTLNLRDQIIPLE